MVAKNNYFHKNFFPIFLSPISQEEKLHQALWLGQFYYLMISKMEKENVSYLSLLRIINFIKNAFNIACSVSTFQYSIELAIEIEFC